MYLVPVGTYRYSDQCVLNMANGNFLSHKFASLLMHFTLYLYQDHFPQLYIIYYLNRTKHLTAIQWVCQFFSLMSSERVIVATLLERPQ